MNYLIFAKNALLGQIQNSKFKIQSAIVCLIILGMANLSGCSAIMHKASVQAPGGDIRVPQPETYPIPIPEPSVGSLWADSGSTKLFVDMRAREVGDLVTVTISETPSAKLDANTKTSRDSSIEAGITDLLGYMKAIEEKNQGVWGSPSGQLDRTSMFKASFKPSFDGKGSSDRSGNVIASITARVVQVLPNANLRILGKREIKVNNETQYITISGTIRPEDIAEDNVIQSAYIADARIEYTGRGIIADKQKPGWLMRILDHVWPF